MNFNIFQIAMNINEPQGIIHPLLQENYAWVDECLREKYFDKWFEKELLNEQYDYEFVNNKLDEIFLLKPTPITWANYKSRAILKGIEDEDEDKDENKDENKDDNEIFITYENRKYAESNYEVNVGKVILNAYSNSLLGNKEYMDDFEKFSTTNSSYDSY
jgi:hypothetical protein